MSQVEVNIKMYRVNELGDCFLLRFRHNGSESNVLIDCGSFRNGDKSKKRLQAIARDIKKQLPDKKLSVVVGTHQHNDHVSGFVHAEDIFKQIKSEQAWLSWLDNPQDKQASRVGEGHRELSMQFHNISEGLNTALDNRFSKAQARERINDVLGFYSAAAAGAPFIPARGVEVIKEISDEVKYVEPGQIIDLPGLDRGAVKVYVLGPPRNMGQLFDKDPGKGESYDHKLAMANVLAANFLSALSNYTASGADEEEEQFPFNNHFGRSLQNGASIPGNYSTKGKEWRKIDEEWLGQAERLALYLDSYTNNSSVVLAFELVESGKVLLFVGDAQTGNWLSWKDIKWGTYGQGFSTYDLLENTVLYKVGHHCSHNATLVDCLEKMSHPELVAMIPVDRTDSNITKVNGWKMPATNLFRRLKEKTNNRVLLMDTGWDQDGDPEIAKNDQWDILPVKPKMNPLYIEYEVRG
jgi:hypothetical protein